MYRIISKVLAERLEKVVDNLVNKHQMAFVKGRQFMDVALITSECIDNRMRREDLGVICKVCIKKPMILSIGTSLSVCLDRWPLAIDG